MNNYLKPIIQKELRIQLILLIKRFYQKVYVYQPTLPNKKAIADVLSTADEEINLLNKKLEALKEQKERLNATTLNRPNPRESELI